MDASPASAKLILPPTADGMTRAAQLIRAGKLVVLPTETVYGIAVNLHSPEARAHAREIKGILQGQPAGPWVVHVGQPEEALAWVPGISPLGRRLLSKALPGPVAFQIKLSPEDLIAARTRLGDAADETLHSSTQHSALSTQHFFLTLRCPDFASSQYVLRESSQGGAIGIIGAGTPRQPAVFEAADVPDTLLGAGRVEAVLDGGPTRYRRPSTLVQIAGDAFSVIREGVIDARIIERMADFQILFLCSGNTCRSPMAAALATRILADRLGIQPRELPLRHIVVQSAGLHATRGLRAAREAIDVVKPLGGDLTTHFSQPTTPDLLRRADVIYTMTDAHRDEVLDQWPAAAAKTLRIDPEADVEDPIGAGMAVYQEVANRLANLLQLRLKELHL